MSRILFIADARSIHSHKWINYIARKSNFKVTWFSLNPSKYEMENKINFINIKINFFYNSLRIIKILCFFRPEIVHIHYVGFHSLYLLFLSNKSRLIINTWGSDLVFSNKNFLKKFWLRYLIKRSTLVISDAYHHFNFLKNFGLKEKKFQYVPYGTDIEFFSPNHDCFQSQKYVVIHTRGLHDHYDLKTFLKAVKLVSDKNSSFEFKVIGSGPKKLELEEYSRKLNISDKVNFLGQLSQKDLRDEINLSDIYVSCSLSDGGIAGCTSEAMACQKLVIISNNSDNHIWISNGINGYLFNNGDYEELSRLILKSVKDIPKSILISKRARQKIIDSNSYTKQMDKIINIYNSILLS
tara:strand:- start:17698 stop:18756 length:1059 start_codon:yes stop_codon:yes gene_type:complete